MLYDEIYNPVSNPDFEKIGRMASTMARRHSKYAAEVVNELRQNYEYDYFAMKSSIKISYALAQHRHIDEAVEEAVIFKNKGYPQVAKAIADWIAPAFRKREPIAYRLLEPAYRFLNGPNGGFELAPI